MTVGLQDVALAAVAVVGLGLLFPLQGVIDQGRPEPMELMDTLPPVELISMLAFGHRESAADMLEIRITNALAKRMDNQSRLDPEELWLLYGAMMTLDPQNAGAAYRASVYLSSTASSPGLAVQMLALSLGDSDPDHPFDPQQRAREPLHGHHPRRWVLYHEWAAIHFLMFRQRTTDPERQAYHARRAGELWLKCAQQPYGPEWLTNVGRKLMGRGLSRRQTLEHEIRLWEEHVNFGDELQRERSELRLKEAKSALIGEALQEKVNALAASGRDVEHLRELPLGAAVKDREHLSDMDPFGVGYYLRGKKVIAPAWLAGKAQLTLSDRFDTYRMVHGKAPTAADLHVQDLEYLRVTFTAEGVVVTPVLPPGR